MRHKHSMTWNMARITEKLENWKFTPQDLDYGEKTDK